MEIRRVLKDLPFFRMLHFYVKKFYIEQVLGEKKWVKSEFFKIMKKELNLDFPVTLNEKIVWLKINYFKPEYINCCDKYLIHDYLKSKLGFDYAPKLLFSTQNPYDLSLKKISVFPCIVKISNGSGSNLIIKNFNEYSDQFLQNYFACQIWISNKHAIESREHQYLEKKPYIVVEELLSDEKGKIPNDYKFLFINGDLQFIYCSVDRIGINVRQVYDKDWNRLHFTWVKDATKELFEKYEKSASITKPKHFDEMLSICNKLKNDFPLVRIDFYDTEDRVYLGEITLHHGSGTDNFYPEEFDEYYGKKLKLPIANRIGANNELHK